MHTTSQNVEPPAEGLGGQRGESWPCFVREWFGHIMGEG